jgi:pimeloyl-ACP methyl ester carboxylesterase
VDDAPRDVSLFSVEHGEGLPVLTLHGAGVDHREVMACLEPVFERLPGYRRIYPDLPGMGKTPAPETISSADDVLDVLLAFLDRLVGDQQLLVVGHSAGGYYAQAIASRRADQVAGLALLCPLLTGIRDVPEPGDVFGSPDLGDDDFRDYFVVRTPATLERYERYVAPAGLLADESALERIGERWEFTPRPEASVPYRSPTLVATVGHAACWDLLEHYPRATFAVLDRAGHALPHEQPELLRALVTEWLGRVHEHSTGVSRG